MTISAFIRQLAFAGIRLSLYGSNQIKVKALKGQLTQHLLNEVMERKPAIIAYIGSLPYWLDQVRESPSASEILAITDRFRPLSWSYEQRAEFSRAYIRRLEQLRS